LVRVKWVLVVRYLGTFSRTDSSLRNLLLTRTHLLAKANGETQAAKLQEDPDP
jgi:hypothetical protein